MNFTREPIIETVITPREGCKLVVRSSKGAGQEDYFVDAVEVVSYGHSIFYRSQERPKSFLLPVSDYEILELKETRMVLKNVGSDKSIKIGGGKPREESQPDVLADSKPAPEKKQEQQRQSEKKRDKRRRGRRGRERENFEAKEVKQPSEELREKSPEEIQAEPFQGPISQTEPEKAPSFISKLFPPPSTLIKESLSKYKPAESEAEEIIESQEESFEETIFDHPTPVERKSDEETEQ